MPERRPAQHAWSGLLQRTASRWAAAWAKRKVRREMQALDRPETHFRPFGLLRPDGRSDYHFRSLVQVNFFSKPRP